MSSDLLQNLGTYMELRTASFIHRSRLSHKRVQVLSIAVLLLAWSLDWTRIESATSRWLTPLKLREPMSITITLWEDNSPKILSVHCTLIITFLCSCFFLCFLSFFFYSLLEYVFIYSLLMNIKRHRFNFNRFEFRVFLFLGQLPYQG